MTRIIWRGPSSTATLFFDTAVPLLPWRNQQKEVFCFFLGEPTIFYWDSSGFLFRVFCTALCDDARSKQASILRSSPLHCGFGWGPIHLGKACFEICFFAAFANKQTLCPLRKKGQKTNERERKAKS